MQYEHVRTLCVHIGAMVEDSPVVLDGQSLSADDVVRVARYHSPVALHADGVARLEASWGASQRLVVRRQVYGRTTGVGANRDQIVSTEGWAEHGLRLSRERRNWHRRASCAAHAFAVKTGGARTLTPRPCRELDALIHRGFESAEGNDGRVVVEGEELGEEPPRSGSTRFHPEG